MVNGGGQQDPIVERLIRLELEMKAGNERSDARFEALAAQFEAQMAATNQRVADAINTMQEANRETNQRVTDAINMLMEVIREASRETNQRIAETDQRITETNRETNQRITEASRETNQRIDGTNAKLDSQGTELRREFRADSNRLVYMMLGIGGAIIASVLATHFF